jgi:uncharacterized protein YbjQ (UPF0145 family)
LNQTFATSRRLRLAALALASSLCAAGPAAARDATRLINVTDALQAAHARELAGDLVLRFGRASEAGADIASRDIGADGEGNRATEISKGIPLPGDEQICYQAFESALTKLVIDARKAGAKAIVGIVSNYEGQVLDDPYHIECHAGTLKAYVSLKAQYARSATSTAPPPPADVTAPLPPAQPAPLPPAAAPAPAPQFQPMPQK